MKGVLIRFLLFFLICVGVAVGVLLLVGDSKETYLSVLASLMGSIWILGDEVKRFVK